MFKPWFQIVGEEAKPQFMLRDAEGREFGVVEWYSNRRLPQNWMGLEFISGAFGNRPFLVFDLDSWKVVSEKSRNLPDDYFEPGLEVFLSRWTDVDRDLRRDRVKRAARMELIKLAEKGYTIAFQEMFLEESKPEDLPVLTIKGQSFLVDDQYGIRPGEFRSEVTLVFLPETARGAQVPAPAFLVNWKFGEGYELIDCQMSEELVHQALEIFFDNAELEGIYRERHKRMRREGVLLGVRPAPSGASQIEA